LGIVAAGLSGALLAGQEPGKNVWSGVYTEAQAERGAANYQEKCARCHADQLTGNDAPALKGGEFTANWNDLSLNDLFDRIQKTMPDDAKGTLTRPEVADLIAVILRANEMPAGETEVPTEADALKAIKFLSVKPAAQ
jgi:mono/diheme cytochrome c family protein